MNSYISTLKQYATFEGRARRWEIGIFTLINLIIAFVLGFIDGMLGTPIAVIFNLAVLCPTLAVGARRLHDMGYSGWWQLLYLIPIVGFILLLVLIFKDGVAGENRFGSDPKGRTGSAQTSEEPQAAQQTQTDSGSASA